jgi:hypothetical protein
MKDFELFGMVVLFGMTANFMYLHYRLDKLAYWLEQQNKVKNEPKVQQKRNVA